LEEIKKDIKKTPSKRNSNEQEIISAQASLNAIPEANSNSRWG